MENANTLEAIEEYFKKVNCYGNEYNYCFASQLEPSILPALFGVAGAAISTVKNKKIMGYLFNKNEKGICLIPIVADTLTKNKIELDSYKFILDEEIESIKIKKIDFVYYNIKIKLKDKTKYNLRCLAKIKDVSYHEKNVKGLVDMYLGKNKKAN